LLPYRTAAQCIDWSIPAPSIFLTRLEAKKLGYNIKRPLTEKTLWRIAQCLRRFVFENPKPFIVNDGVRTGISFVQQSGYGERKGQQGRGSQLELPLGTVVAGGAKHALVTAFISQYFGDPNRKNGGGVVLGKSVAEPLPTVTTRDHNSLVAVSLVKFRGTSASHPGCADISEPLPTVSSGGNHAALVCAFLSVYYGSDASGGQQLLEPMRTITAKARLGLVTIYGTDYQIDDIGFRMLQPHELLAAQCGEYASNYDLSAAKTVAEQIALIGNMVCPHPAMALVKANPRLEEVQAA
jgi:DNA (cytosine-5)-methyltransferase 1